MSITFPTTLDNFSNPAAGNPLNSPSHSLQHSNENDAIEALEAKVGVDSSAVTTSHDYKLSAVTGSAKALTSGTSTQSVTNLTIVTPTFTLNSDATGDMFYRNSGGSVSRLPIGTASQILQTSAAGIPEWIANPAASDASTTVKGVVEEATLAETLARTTAGGTSARLFVNPSTLTTVMTYDYVADTGSATAYAIAPTPAITAYVTGQEFTFKATATNTTTTPTLAVSGLASPKTIINVDGTALKVGDIVASGIYVVKYDGTNMQLISKTPATTILQNTVNADETQSGWITTTTLPGSTGWTGAPTGQYLNGANWSNTASIASTGQLGYESATPGFTIMQFAGSSGKVVKIKCTIASNSSSTSNFIYFGIVDVATNASSQTNSTDKRIQFLMDSATMWAITSDTSTNTNTALSGVSLGVNVPNILEIVWTPTTSVKFYVNGVLKATHTTSIPAGNTAAKLAIGSVGAGTAVCYGSQITLSQQL